MPLQSLLADKQILLTDSQKKAAQYIMEHYEESIFLTAAKLGHKAGVSEATMVRFARALGFNGFSELQQMLRDHLQDRLTTFTRLEQTIKSADSDGNILSKVMRDDIRNLTETLRGISLETFYRAVTDLDKAKRIEVVGLRGAHAPALILALYLRYLGKRASAVVPGYGDIWNNLFGLGAGDLVIGISIPRYTKLTIEIMEYAKENGTRVGVITDSLLSPIACHADWVFPIQCRLDSFIESFTAAMSLVNALLTELSVRNPENTMKTLKERELLWRKKDIYVLPSTGYKKNGKKGRQLKQGSGIPK